MSIQEQLIIVQNQIAALAKKYARDPGSITLLAASKGQNTAKIKEAITAGQRVFGENYLQEALPKITALANITDLVWHYIGPLQSNKAKDIAQYFHWVQSVDREKTALLLNKHRPENLPPLNICVEVNINNETSKSGVAINDVAPLMQIIQQLPKLRLRGIMAIPKASAVYQTQLQSCRIAQELFISLQKQRFNLDTLSLGMSGDLEAAIASGSTMVRVGTGIFGERV